MGDCRGQGLGCQFRTARKKSASKRGESVTNCSQGTRPVFESLRLPVRSGPSLRVWSARRSPHSNRGFAGVGADNAPNRSAILHFRFVHVAIDALDYFAVCPATNPLSCEQASASALTAFNLLPCFFKPVTAKVRLAGDAVAVDFPDFLDVIVAKFAAHGLVPKKRRIAVDHIALQPLAFCMEFQGIVPPALARLRFLERFGLAAEVRGEQGVFALEAVE